MGQTMARIARIVAGVACLVLGVLGLFLPFLQGILFLVIGLTLLSRDSERARHWLEWLRAHVGRKHPAQVGEHDDGRG